MSMRPLRMVPHLVPAALAALVLAGGAVADDPKDAAGGANPPAAGRLTTRDDHSRASADNSLRSDLRQSASLLELPGLVAGVVRDGKLSLVHADGFADLENRLPMRQDHILHL
jgi:CubicO group peptidase (beta-lactamase class C family)